MPHKDFDQLVESFNAFDYKHFDKVFVETRRLDIFVIAQKKARCKFPIMNSTLISRKWTRANFIIAWNELLFLVTFTIASLPHSAVFLT